MELPAWAADDEAPVRRWHGGEEGMEARGFGDVRCAVVLGLYHPVKDLVCLTLTHSAVSSWYLREIA